MENSITELPDLSIIILCYRSGNKIKEFVTVVLQVLEARGVSNYELVLVGNYHKDLKDDTPIVVSWLAVQNPKIKFVAKEKEGMMGWDMKSGLELARGNYLAVIDGDGQMPIEDLIRVYEKIKNESLDLVKTYRLNRGDSFLRKSISFIYNCVFAMLFPGTKSCDINSKPKIFSRESYQSFNLKSDDWFIDAEIMIQSRRLGLHIAEIPTVFLGLEGRRSFIRPVAIIEFIKNLIIYRFREFKYIKLKDNHRT